MYILRDRENSRHETARLIISSQNASVALCTDPVQSNYSPRSRVLGDEFQRYSGVPSRFSFVASNLLQQN